LPARCVETYLLGELGIRTMPIPICNQNRAVVSDPRIAKRDFCISAEFFANNGLA
jgi:hypothetical protein